MLIPIKEIILEVTLKQLEQANKRMGKNVPQFKKDYATLKPDSVTAINLYDNGYKTAGPTTTPNRSKFDKDFNDKLLTNSGMDIDKNTLKNPGIYSKGQMLNTFKPLIKEEGLPLDKYAHRGANAITQNHELNEYKQLDKNSKNPATTMGAQFGHHSLAKILGNERNIILTGDKRIKQAGEFFNHIRSDSGELDYLKHFAPKNKNGNDMMPSYNEGPKLNRRHLRAIYSKELGLNPGASKKDIMDLNKKVVQAKQEYLNG